MSPEVIAKICEEATKRKIPNSNALAVGEVESNGVMFAEVDGAQLPLMRWEGHYFDKLVKPSLRERARVLGLASPVVGGIKNPKKQSDRYKKLLIPAVSMDRQAGYSSASYGGFQVMGGNAQDLGYLNAEALYKRCMTAEGQIEVLFKFIDHNGLVAPLQRGDFAAFARVYNGERYKVNKYDTKLAAAAKKFTNYNKSKTILDTGAATSKPADSQEMSTFLRLGTSGAKVREAQTLLNRGANQFHYAMVQVDGDFGPATGDAVTALQKAQGWRGKDVDGMIGPKTWAVLDKLRSEASEMPGSVGLLETDEAKSGGATAIGGTALTAGVEQAKDALYPVVGSGGVVDHIYTILTIIGVLVVLGGVAWAAYGWLKAKRTNGIAAQTVEA